MPTLYVVATPIGNLKDISPRALETLRGCALIAAEDTRVTRKLLAHFDIRVPLISCHRHNEARRSDEITARMLDEGIDVALTCDAGTPALSDPGYALVEAAWAAGIRVVPVCGASALTTALSASGFDSREFAFYGFLRREKGALREKLAAIAGSGVPVAVIYESPHRIVGLMEQVAATLPGALAAVCCDLSKYYETIERGDAETVLELLRVNPNVKKGEYTVVLDLRGVTLPEEDSHPAMDTPELVTLSGMLDGRSLEDAAREATLCGLARNEAYRAKLRVKRLFAAYTLEKPTVPDMER